MGRRQCKDDTENAHKKNNSSRSFTRLKKKPLRIKNRIPVKEETDDDAVKLSEVITTTIEEELPAQNGNRGPEECNIISDATTAITPRTWLKVSCEALASFKTHNGDVMGNHNSQFPSSVKEVKSTADTFEAGTLVWAFMSGYALWPAIVTTNKEENTHIRSKKMKNCLVDLVHIQFFGDRGRHSWIAKCSLVIFNNGLEGLRETAGSLELKMVNNKKFLTALQLSVKGGRGGAWDKALKEATTCEQFTTLSERLEYFFSLVATAVTDRKQKLGTSKPAFTGRKRKPCVSNAAHDEDKTMACPPVDKLSPEQEDAKPKQIKLARKLKKETRQHSCSSCCKMFDVDLGCELPEEESLCPECLLLCCFICKDNEATSPLAKCAVSGCTYNYHEECFGNWPVAAKESEKDFLCPLHFCHTCSIQWKQNGAEGELRQHKKLIRCILCPTAFHSECLAVGCLRISSTKILCHRHGKSWKAPVPIHVNWCFTCSKGGKLLCCDRCPASFHLDCLNLPSEPNGSYLCEDCQMGSTILLGDIVWVRMGHYRWWPARVPLTEEIPDHLSRKAAVPGQFVVQFYGTHDYAVIHRGQAFHYQEGDTGGKESSKSSLAIRFQTAVQEAAIGYHERQQLLNERSVVLASSLKTKPPPYVRIRNNQYVGKERAPAAASSIPCDCTADMPNPCSPNSNCINRILLFECNPVMCAAGEKCENRRLQKRLYSPMEIFRTASKGWGLKSTTNIKKGDLVIEYVGEVIDEMELKKRLKMRQEAREESFYFLTLDASRVIDAGPKGNQARFMNHSCNPNCETQKWTVQGDTRIGLFALTDVAAGTELTFNYQLECAVLEGEQPQNQQPCLCGASNCLGFIGAKPKPRKENANKDIKVKPAKRKRKNPKQRKLEQAEDLCFRCRDGGDLILCDNASCNKVYHLECLSLATPPKGAWTCPWHHCDTCGKKSTIICNVCPSSVCNKHVDSLPVKNDPRFGTVCEDHVEEYLKSVLEDREKRSFAM